MTVESAPHARPLHQAVARLASRFRGDLIEPGDPAYDSARRIWNGSIDRRPALIARCATTGDVVAAVRWGRDVGLPIAVRGGGHSFPGHSMCDDGLVIDLRNIRDLNVDPGNAIVRAGGGALLGDVDSATQMHGLAVPLGAVSHTGIGGLTLGGGIGWLMRQHGLTIDRLGRATLVTAGGDVVTADATEHDELFWALRGGGGNFGIVTEFTYELRPVGPAVFGGVIYWDLRRGATVGRFYRDWLTHAPDALTTALVIRRAPVVDVVPTAIQGRPVIAVAFCWSGDLDTGERVLEPLRRSETPLLDLAARRPLVEMQSILDPSYPHGLWAYLRTTNLAELTDPILDLLLEHGAGITSLRTAITVWHSGGAVARADPSATAYGGRTSGHIVNVSGATDSSAGFDHERAWTRQLGAALTPHGTGAYVNFLTDQGEAAVEAAYGMERFARLRAVKRTYDPDNVFRMNQNIAPA